jgi:RHS repeat-associated protein
MWLDSSVGLYYVRARVYDAEVGRFLTNDDAPWSRTRPENAHRSSFARSNPYGWRDPTGHYSVQDFMASTVVQTTLATLNAMSMLRGAFAVLRAVSSGTLTQADALDIGFGVLGAAGLGFFGPATSMLRAGAGVGSSSQLVRAATYVADVRPARVVATLAPNAPMEHVIANMARRAFETGLEHAWIVDDAGQGYLVAGGRTGIDFSSLPSMRALLAHTHPTTWGTFSASVDDLAAMSHHRQSLSMIVHVGDDGRHWTEWVRNALW